MSMHCYGDSTPPLPAGQLTKRALVSGDTEKGAREWANEPQTGAGYRQIAEHERGPFAQYWPFPANPRCRAVNQKGREFEVGLFGSPNRIRTDSLLVNRANLSYFATLSDSEQNCLACAGNQSDECDRRGHSRARRSHENETLYD